MWAKRKEFSISKHVPFETANYTCGRISVALQRTVRRAAERVCLLSRLPVRLLYVKQPLMTSKHVWSPQSAQLSHKDKHSPNSVRRMLRCVMLGGEPTAPWITRSQCLCMQLWQRRSPDKCHLSNRGGHEPSRRHGQGYHRGPRVVQPRGGRQHHFQPVLHWFLLHHGPR